MKSTSKVHCTTISVGFKNNEVSHSFAFNVASKQSSEMSRFIIEALKSFNISEFSLNYVGEKDVNFPYEKQDIIRTIRQSLCIHAYSKTEIRQDCVGNWCYFTSCPSCGALLSKERYYPSEILALYDDSDIRQISTKGRI